MNEIVSTLSSARTYALIYSGLGAHARFRQKALPGTWFVRAFEPLGHSASAVRQALFRMLKKGELVAAKKGRRKHYSLSNYGQAAVDATVRKMMLPNDDEWDGRWTIVTYHFEQGQRAARERIRWLMELEGFGLLSRGVHIHPQDCWSRISASLEEWSAQVHALRGQRLDSESDAALVARLWDLRDLDTRYGDFLRTYRPYLDRKNLEQQPALCFALRLALAIRYSEIAWGDPGLPPSLLPANWRGGDARRLTHALYQRCIEGTLTHGEKILRAVGG